MSPWRMTRWERGDTPPHAHSDLGDPATSDDGPQRRHEALVSVRLGPSAPGSHLVEYLRHEPCAVDAWWIAADVDAVIRLSADSMTVLHRAVADLRLRAGVEVAEANYILRALDLGAPADPRTPEWAGSAA
ncbi:hypothetical protein [Micromonospora sp. WMMD1155]|uniref:hypothetical protein n=1 Tax=Micromonospora sp. WMMD1155 TaxID=3016094 RepID=UPI00249B5D0A|nr:hypothetical protein [Micromonospora sp. WMMD1155]WFE50505.1 hypothetical protein O7617_09310 [Micromonospora sp. WMMD1155]